MRALSLEEVAREAGVDHAYVERLVKLGAFDGDTGPFGPSDARRVRLLRAWGEAGLSVEAIIDLIRSGELSTAWLDSTVMTRAARADVTFEHLCAQEEVPLDLIPALYEAIGFAPPDPSSLARQGDRVLVGLVRALIAAGAEERPTLRLLRVYADSLRRVAKAEAELYESQIEGPLRRSGMREQELIDHSVRFGTEIIASLEEAILDIYHRYREHIWVEHSVNHAEVALERGGLFTRVSRPPSICFVDLTGYTRLTEEHGDEFAARLASNLASLVEDISLRHGGQPIRWLGDGGMFHFKDAAAAVRSGLDMVESAPGVGLPPMHVGIHTGPVIFQDGDVYGRTVNLASRIASHAQAGEVLVSEETVERSQDEPARFEPLGGVSLKGVAGPVELFRAVRGPSV